MRESIKEWFTQLKKLKKKNSVNDEHQSQNDHACINCLYKDYDVKKNGAGVMTRAKKEVFIRL